MQSGCRWVYTLMDWDTGEVVAKGTGVELVEQGYFPDVNKLSSVWNNLEKCKNPSPKNYRWKMERKSTKACTSPAALRGWRWSCARNGSGTP